MNHETYTDAVDCVEYLGTVYESFELIEPSQCENCERWGYQLHQHSKGVIVTACGNRFDRLCAGCNDIIYLGAGS